MPADRAPAGPARSAAPVVPPLWSDPEVAELLDYRYGLRAEAIHRLGGEVDQNLAVVCADARRVVVKIGPEDTELDRLRWQHELLAGLGAADAVPPVPRIVPALDGTDVILVRRGERLHPIRVQTWLPGRTMAELGRHSPQLLREWGRAAAHLVLALPPHAPPGMQAATHHWDALRAPEAVQSAVWAVRDRDHVRDVGQIVRWFDEIVTPLLADLPQQVVHQDLNDFNVLAQPGPDGRYHLSGVLDFADALHTARVSELAIAVAYAMLRKSDPLSAAAEVVGGFCELVPLTDAELRSVYPIAAARLCVNATTWTARELDNGDYARARMKHTWPTVRLLARLPPSLAEAWLREAAGDRGPTPAEAVLRELAADPPGTAVAVSDGRHLAPAGEPVRRRTAAGAPATLRLGRDLAASGSAPVHSPRPGTVERITAAGLVLRHDGPVTYWSRWSRIDSDLRAGHSVAACRTTIGRSVDGHPVRVALFTSSDAAELAPAEVVAWPSAPAWRRISPDPATFLGHPPAPADDDADPLDLRARHFAGSQRSYYAEPPRLVSSDDVWLYDDRGLAYLDAINNVSHVGHANPAVVAALSHQAGQLNTNSRFVYDGIARYAARLTELLPDPLEVVFLVCSGSEANDLALRIARQVTGREDVMVIDGAYHGNTGAVTAISPDRYNGPGGQGAPPTTHEVVQPNRYRGAYGYDDPRAGERYAADVAEVAARTVAAGRPPAAFIAESLMGTAGTIVHPPGYLGAAFDAVRAAGGLCISDEVQVGFGRLGSRFWGFETQQVVPDIVTMGKPIGNGHPMAAVVTTRAVADAFDTGMKYFNTFGGNPVSCAVGLAVLDEIAGRRLQASAAEVGEYLRDRLRALMRRHPLIGDVRGQGLYLGVELVRDRETKQPAGAEARHLSERMKDEGVLVYPTGPHDNVLKIKPPMTFTRAHADLFATVLDDVLSEDW